MRRLLAFILRPVFYFGLRFMDWEPWERLSHGIAPPQFGAGSRHDFRWYFEVSRRFVSTTLRRFANGSLTASTFATRISFTSAIFGSTQ